MRTPFEDPVFRRMAFIHGITEEMVGEIGNGIAWRMTPVFGVVACRYVDGLMRDVPAFMFIQYRDDGHMTLEMELKTGGRGAGAIEYVAGNGRRQLLVRDRVLPDTVMAGLAGAGLGELIRHPCLPDQTIVSVRTMSSDQDLRIEVRD